MGVTRSMQRQAARRNRQYAKLGLGPRGTRTRQQAVLGDVLGQFHGTYQLGNSRTQFVQRSTAPLATPHTRGLWGRGFTHVGGMAATALLASSVVLAAMTAQADEYEGLRPAFDPLQRVYFVPSDYQNGFVAEHGGIAILSAELFTGSLHFPFYIVIFHSVGGPVRDADTTNDAGWEVVKAWQQDGRFDARRATVIALSMVERSVAIQPAMMWQEGLGLQGDALTRLAQDIFIPYAKNGRFTDGLKALAEELDRRYTAGLGEAQTRVRQALQEAAALAPSIPAGIDTTTLQAARAKAETAVTATDFATLRDASAELLRQISTLQQSIQEIATAQGQIKATVEYGDRLLAEQRSYLIALAPTYRTARARAVDVAAGSDREALRAAGGALEHATEAMKAHVQRWTQARGRLQGFLSLAKERLFQYEQIFSPTRLDSLRAALSAAAALDAYDLEGHERVAIALDTAMQPLQDYVESLESECAAVSALVDVTQWKLQTHAELLAGTNTAKVQAAMAAAQQEALRNDVNTIYMARMQLEAEAAELDGRIKELERQRAIRRALTVTGAVAALALLLGSLLYGLRRRRRYRRGVEQLLRDLKELEDKKSAAYQQMLTLIQRRNATEVTTLQQVHGERTTAVMESVRQQIVTIFGGLEALEARVAECRGIVAAALFTQRLPAVERAAQRLLEPLSFQRETVRATKTLFAVDETTVTVEKITMADFQAGLEQRYADAQQAWERVEAAIDATARDPREDFPLTGLQTLRGQLVEARLPIAWLDQHPLTQPERTWSELDALKQRDPVGYLEQLEWHQEWHAKFEVRIAAIIEDVQAARTAQAQSDAIAVDYAQTVVRGADDPREAETLAQRAMAELDTTLTMATGNAAEEDDRFRAVDRLAAAVVAAYAEVQRRKERVLEVMRSVAGQLATARETIAHLDGEFAAIDTEAKALAREHSKRAMEAVTMPLAEAVQDRSEAAVASTTATHCLERREHFAAAAMAQRIADEGTEMTEDLARARAAIRALRAAKQEASATILRAAARITELERAQNAGNATVAGMRTDFSGADMAEAGREVHDAAVDLQEARAALERARAQADAREYVAALQEAQLALRECQEAAEDQTDAARYVKQLRDAAAEFAQRRAALDELRRKHATKVQGYNGDMNSYLRGGDELLTGFQTPSGAVDWATQLAQLHAIEKSWQRGVAEAKTAYEKEQRRIAEARAEKERLERAAEARRERELAVVAAAVAARRERAAAAACRPASTSTGGGGRGYRGGGGGASW